MSPPLPFREERFDEAFPSDKEARTGQRIEANVREIEAEDVLDLRDKRYGYARPQEAGT